MAEYPRSVKKLVEELAKLPGIGPRSAERIAFHIIRSSPEEAKALSLAISKVKDGVGYCQVCCNLSEDHLCQICKDQSRDREAICVVEQPKDVTALERTGSFRGLYHVLLGVLSPLEGIGPENLKVKELIARVKGGKVKEVVLATDSDTEGETTALYLVTLLKPLGVKTTRIAYGIPVGGNLEYADQATLARALDGRREF